MFSVIWILRSYPTSFVICVIPFVKIKGIRIHLLDKWELRISIIINWLTMTLTHQVVEHIGA